ncbi:DUF262 domain-containing protein [Psychrobacter sp. I-STPA6b]|uniref:DUF262 domain-containing protein n=1 Tax=Psychrobacter sp. I-STPA6b TaxID=2585718 RepID=UPI001D0C5050|nr:DUF262 domain-containing protein [Psychrobacter sp. I-STPA6b]
MKNKPNYQGESLTFYQLLNKYAIEVPIIQRDYAQGRESQSKIRSYFLKALYESLHKDEILMLDFIYGSIENNKFQPLDGQQRLTTLFLLHCYASITSKIPYDTYKILANFSYETRMTSRDFCRKLVENLNTFPEIGEDNDSVTIKISSIIKDSSWFFLSWKNDSTISAMLNTLDDIHENFFKINNLWDKLTTKNIIQFYYIELEYLGLTDDLYIKMNARGKLLTTFENFKAGIEKRVYDFNWESKIPAQKSFKVKIDTKWTDFLWSNFRKYSAIDESFVRFFSFVFMVDLASTKQVEDTNDIIKSLQENPHNISIDWLTESSFRRLVNYLDLLTEYYPSFLKNKLNLELFRHEPQENLLHEVLTHSPVASYTQKVLLFAQIKYLEKIDNLTGFDTTLYNNWMRVIRNIIAFGNIDKNGKRPDIIRSPQAFIGVLNLIIDLSAGANNIYNFLADKSNIISSTFSKAQVEEERVKATLILQNPERKNIIYDLEDTDTLRGRLEFIFYCLDYIPEHCNFDDEKFRNISQAFIKHLGSEVCLTNNLRRALLTIKGNSEYNFYDYWQSYWYLEDMSKRKLIDNYREIEYLLHSYNREYFKILIHKLTSMSLEEIIETFEPPEKFPNWKLQLIKDETLLDNSKSHYIAIAEDNSFCYLLKSIRPRDLEGSIKII